MRFFILVILFVFNAYALSPLSVEGFKAANVKIFDKQKVLTKENKQKIKKELFSTLEKHGIQTKSENFSNLILKIESIKVEGSYVININFFIVEDIIPSRNKELENMGITYRKSDFFATDADDLQSEIYDSVIDFILFDFIEQYKDENN